MTALHLTGAALVVLGGTLCSRLQCAHLKRREAALAAVCTLLLQLRAEIVERRAPMREIALTLRENAPEACRAWFSALSGALDAQSDDGFAAIWRRTLETHAALPLRRDETESLCLLGLSLGRYDAPEQGAAIDRCLCEMERAHARAREETQTKCRLYTGLGPALGALLALVLL